MRRVVVMLLVSASLLVINVSAVSAAPPGNDRIGRAVVFTGIPFSHSVETSDATRSVSDPDCADDAHTVWYRFRPSTDGDIVATTAGSDYDTTLSVYTGKPGDLRQIDCSDDAGGSTSQIRFAASAGRTYQLMAGSCCGQPGGNLRLRVLDWKPFEIDVTVRRARIDPRIGDVVVSGTITCSIPTDGMNINVRLRQKRPDETMNYGDGWISETACDRGSRRWRVLVAGQWAFRPGWARVLVDVHACADDCIEENINRVIWLRRMR